MGTMIVADVRDYNGFIISRNAKGEVVKYVKDNLSDKIKLKNMDIFGRVDDKGKFIEGRKTEKLKSTEKEKIKNEINESNRRLEKWQQEQ